MVSLHRAASVIIKKHVIEDHIFEKLLFFPLLLLFLSFHVSLPIHLTRTFFVNCFGAEKRFLFDRYVNLNLVLHDLHL